MCTGCATRRARSAAVACGGRSTGAGAGRAATRWRCGWCGGAPPDRKSTRLNSSHMSISYAVFCLKKNIELYITDTRYYHHLHSLSHPAIHPSSLHDALPISLATVTAEDGHVHRVRDEAGTLSCSCLWWAKYRGGRGPCSHALAVRMVRRGAARSEEHTSELQSHVNLVCRLLLEKKYRIIHY